MMWKWESCQYGEYVARYVRTSVLQLTKRLRLILVYTGHKYVTMQVISLILCKTVNLAAFIVRCCKHSICVSCVLLLFAPSIFVRVSIGAKKGGSFNSTPTDGSERIRRFEQLLNGPVGDALCRMYARYWQPAGMARYLEEAALYSKDHKSTVSITDSVSSIHSWATDCSCVYHGYHDHSW